MWGQQNNAEILYEISDISWVFEQLNSKRMSDYSKWKFFDEWVKAQHQKTVLENAIENPTQPLTRKKL